MWFKLQFEPDTEFALELAAPYLDDVRFYVLNAAGDLIDEVHTGDQQPFAQRPLPSSTLLFPIQPAWVGQSYQYLFRLENSGALVFPLHYLHTKQQLALLQQAMSRQQPTTVIVLEGQDAAGKGGIIRRLAWCLDPRWLHVWPISAPNEIERQQHWLRHQKWPGHRLPSI